MTDQIMISYPHGTMLINLKAFFPCSQDRLKGLLKVITADREHGSDILYQCLNYCTLFAAQRDNDREHYKGQYCLVRSDREACEERIREGKEANGLPLSYNSAKAYTNQKYSLKAKENRLEKNYKQADRDIRQLDLNIKNIEKLIKDKGW